MKFPFTFWKFTIQDHRMPKRIGQWVTTAPSHFRVFWNKQFLFDIPWRRVE